MDNDYRELVEQKQETDRLLEENKKFFFIVTGILVVAALWNFYYIWLAGKEFGLGFLSHNYLYLCIGAIALAALSGIIMICTKYRFEIVWFIIVVMLGALSMRVMPGLSAPDDPIHFTSAYYLSNQLMFKEAADENNQVYIRETDRALFDENFGLEITAHTYEAAENWKEDHEIKSGMSVSPVPRQATTPIVYLPQALGISLARLMNLNADVLVSFARAFNLLAYAAIIYLALTIMPFGREIMAAVTFIPMAVELSSSCSYDAMLIALSFLYIAMILNLAYKAEKVTWKDILLLIIVLGALSPCKIIYGIFIFFILMIPKEKFSSTGQYVLLWVLAAIVIIAGVVFFNFRQIETITAPGEDIVAWSGVENYSASYCLRHPFITLKIIIESVMTEAQQYHETLIGYYVGNESGLSNTPYIVIVFISVILGLLGLKNNVNDFELKIKDKVIVSIVFVLLCAMIFGTMLIGWTPVDSDLIIGVQGRYLIPILPLMIMLIKNNKLKFDRDYSRYLLYLIVSADAFAYIRLFAVNCLQK